MNFYRTELYYLSRGKNIGIFPVSLTSVCTSYKAHLFVNESKAIITWKSYFVIFADMEKYGSICVAT
jgi:hypothetical protein